MKAETPELIEVPRRRFLAVDGKGAPERDEFQNAVGALYAIAYTAKFMLKRSGGDEFKVPPLEGLYAEEEHEDWFTWTLLLPIPDIVDDELITRAREAAAVKRDNPALGKVRTESLDEGLCAQVLHVGPYSAEPATIERLHSFIREQSRAPRGRHHEIYLGDPRRTKPERLKTLLRQPVA